MTSELDLAILPLFRTGGKESATFPGLQTVTPDRKAARGREKDRLIIFLTLSGNVSFSASDYNRITSRLAEQFFQSPGSLTTALRSTVERLNRFLVEQNMHTTGRGQYIIGRLMLGVLRGRQLVLAQSGPTHAFHLEKDQARQVHDPAISGRGLGLNQTTQVYFTQLSLDEGDLLVLCSQMPAGWGKALLSERRTSSMDTLRRKLLSIDGDDLNAIFIQPRAGTGKMAILRNAPPGIDEKPAIPDLARAGKPADEKKSGVITLVAPEKISWVDNWLKRTPGTEPDSTTPVDLQAAPNTQQEQTPATPSQNRSLSRREQILAGQYDRPQATSKTPQRIPFTRQVREASEKPDHSPQKPPSPKKDKKTSTTTARGNQFYAGVLHLLQVGRQAGQTISTGLQKMIPRILPEQAERNNTLPGSTMTFIAIAVPILVVTIASIVFMRFGRVAQYEEYYQLAIQQALSIVEQEDPAIARLNWEQTLYYLDKAESYQITQQSQALRQEAQNALDGMDSIVRLNFSLAIQGGLGNAVKVVRMAASDDNLFLLDATSGSVKHASLGDQIYMEDKDFQCRPGMYENEQAGTLLDIAIPPLTNFHQALLMGIDGNGKLIYCQPGPAGGEPDIVPLIAPDVGFRGIAGFALNATGQTLYVLDPPANAIWVYENDDGDFSRPPMLFFGMDVPTNMSSSIDLAVNGDNLYLLFQDGSVTTCSLSLSGDASSTRCNNITMQDTRPGHQSGTTITDAIFTQMAFTSPPDPSLYMLEPLTQAIFRFTPHYPDGIILQGQFRATETRSNEWIGRPATAMAISPNRYLFLSIGNQVYFASDVP